MDGPKRKKQAFYPKQLKLQVATEILCEKKGPTEASREYNIGRRLIYHWLKRFEAEILEKRPVEVLPSLIMKKSTVPQQKPDLEKRVQILEEENLKLRKKLMESNLQTEALNTMIDLVEEQYGLSLRKNSGAKQSTD